MAGNGTIGLEVPADLADADAIVAPWAVEDSSPMALPFSSHAGMMAVWHVRVRDGGGDD